MFGAYWPVRLDPPHGSKVFRVLKYADKEWVARHCALPPNRRDINFDPRNLAPYLKAYGCELGLAVTGDAYTLKNFIMQPILVTKDGHLVHGYNFGGPIAPTDEDYQELGIAHQDGLLEWAVKRGVTKECCILSPFLVADQIKYFRAIKETTQYVTDSVVVDLGQFKGKSLSSDVEVKSCHIYTNLHHFLKFYDKDQILNAIWFEWYAKFIYPHLFLAYCKGKVVGACLVVYKGIYQNAYCYFTGIEADCPPETSHLLISTAAETVKSLGAKNLYLGGGIKSGLEEAKLPTYLFMKNYE